MKALVTGGLGFIGSHLVDFLLEKGWKVTVVDNLSHNSVSPETYSEKMEVYPISISKYKLDQNFDVIFHLASIVGPAGVLKHGGEIGHRVVDDIRKVIRWVYQTGARLVDVSTSEVYGKEGYLSERTPKIVEGEVSIRNEYGVAKLLSEIMIQNSCKMKTFEWNIIRPFNVAGPRQQPDAGFVTPRFVQQALRGDPITVFDTGKQRRAFTHVYDIVKGLYLAATHEISNEVFNLGNPNNETTILDYAKLAKRMCHSNSKIEFTSGQEIYGNLYTEVPDKLPISTKARTKLGWIPKKSLKDIIQDYIDFYENASIVSRGKNMRARMKNRG